MSKITLADITKKTFTEQGIWWLNGFWEEKGVGADQAEAVWNWVAKFKEIHFGRPVVELKGKKKEQEGDYVEGSDLDEHQSHRFLESVGETLTAITLRKRLESLDLDKNHRMALVEYLMSKFSKTPDQLVKAPQGNKDELDAAEELLNQVQAALNDVTARLEQQKEALEDQKKQEAAAKKADADAATALELSIQADESARVTLEQSVAAAAAAATALEIQQAAEAEVRAAEAEVKAAVDDLKAQEAAYHGKIAELTQKTQDDSVSAMQKSKAANELAQLKSEDPLPLRKAKITQEAVLKKAEKKRKEAEEKSAQTLASKQAADAAKANAEEKAAAAAAAKAEAISTKAAAEEAAAKAEAARLEAEEQTRQVAAARADLEKKFEECQANLEAIKAKPGLGQGQLWWLQRKLDEAAKFMPGYVNKKK